MAMTRISKGPEAPDGPIRFSFSNEKPFTVDTDKPYETDNHYTIQDVRKFEDRGWVVVEAVEGEDDPRAAAKAEVAALRQFDKEEAAADKANAKRDIVADPVV